MPDEEELNSYTRKEAAAYAKCCLKTIDRDIASGKLIAKRISRRRVRIPYKALKDYQAGKFPATADQSGRSPLNDNDARDCATTASVNAIREDPKTVKTSAFSAGITTKATGKEVKKPIINSLSHSFKVVVLWPDLEGPARN